VWLDRDGRRSLDLLRWGLIPYWAKDTSIGPRCINAMAETLATKPAFRDAFQRRRCLVPVDGFYEWAKLPAGKKWRRSISPLQRAPRIRHQNSRSFSDVPQHHIWRIATIMAAE
jgi:putative SOS response-associated peptidase YedK